MNGQRLMWVAWPAFLAACLLELVVFAMVDPSELHWRGEPLAASRQAIYTVSFFFFWLVAMGSSLLTTTLAMSPFEVNRCPVPPDQRPTDCAMNADACAGKADCGQGRCC